MAKQENQLCISNYLIFNDQLQLIHFVGLSCTLVVDKSNLMTVRRRLRDSGIKVGLMVILFFLSVKSCAAKGETTTFNNSEYSYAANRHLAVVSAGEKAANLLYL